VKLLLQVEYFGEHGVGLGPEGILYFGIERSPEKRFGYVDFERGGQEGGGTVLDDAVRVVSETSGVCGEQRKSIGVFNP